MERALSGATTPGQSGPKNNGNEKIPRIAQTPGLLAPHHQIVWDHLLDTRWRSLTPLQKCSRSILKPQPTGPDIW